MKHTLSHCLLAVLACCLAACSQTDGWVLEGSTSFPQYTSALLLHPDADRPADTLAMHDGAFRAELPGKVSKPYPVVVRLQSGTDPSDCLDMPVMVENGKVKLSIGEYIHLSGTPLNVAIQEFLDGLQDCKDGCLQQTGLGMEEITARFSDYYLQQIIIHSGDALGPYIYRTYGVHLTEEDRLKADKVLNQKQEKI